MASDALSPSSIVQSEVDHFNAQAAEWWDPKGSSAMLHRINPVRLRFIRAAVDRHWGTDARALRPLAGKRTLDVGCGAGLVCEPLARLGAEAMGLDAAPDSIAAARDHAANQGLDIHYRQGRLEDLAEAPFDLVTCLEVIEHVADPDAFVGDLARLLKPGGLMILSTPNRTARSRLAMITLGEGLGMIPRGTHDWDKFLTPEELETILSRHDLTVGERTGITFRPDRGFARGDDLALNYILSAAPVERHPER